MTKRAFVTGITGQDGAYLAKHLLEMGDYEVIGLVRRTSSNDFSRLRKLGVDPRSVRMETFDLSEPFNMQRLIRRHSPDEIYNLAAQSFVGSSFDIPAYTMEVNSIGVCRIVDAILNTNKDTRFYQASTSEMFGKVQQIPQSESTPFYPRSPYGVAKLSAFWYVKNTRESYDWFGCNGILFNHESPIRGEEFVTRKITLGLANLHLNGGPPVMLGNMNSKRDWGHAADYVRAMHAMLQQDAPDDYVISSDETHCIREFCEIAAQHLGYDVRWEGEGLGEKGIDAKSGKMLFGVDERFFRPAEVDLLLGDSTKARTTLGWQRRYSFSDLVEEMMRSDLDHVRRI